MDAGATEPLPWTMRALVKETAAPGAALREVAVPDPGPGELLVRVLAASVCGTDVHIERRGPRGRGGDGAPAPGRGFRAPGGGGQSPRAGAGPRGEGGRAARAGWLGGEGGGAVVFGPPGVPQRS